MSGLKLPGPPRPLAPDLRRAVRAVG